MSGSFSGVHSTLLHQVCQGLEPLDGPHDLGIQWSVLLGREADAVARSLLHLDWNTCWHVRCNPNCELRIGPSVQGSSLAYRVR